MANLMRRNQMFEDLPSPQGLSYHSLRESRRMTFMDNAFVNHALEVAAKRTLTHLTWSEDTLKLLYLQPDRSLFLAENRRITLKFYTEATPLQHSYATPQHLPSIT